MYTVLFTYCWRQLLAGNLISVVLEAFNLTASVFDGLNMYGSRPWQENYNTGTKISIFV
jgi:hypothetical protein